jgi:signal peptidase I
MEAIFSAVLIVLLINQYLLQAYQIPSQSMVSTLEIGDRIFVNKLIYGPELIPGILKVRGFREPRRGEVIIFENPSYIPIGPVKDILQRVIYMLTLSLVNIDRDEFGKPKHHFLIKRAVGMAGDRIRMNRGEVELLVPGSSTWMAESELKAALNMNYPVRRIFRPQEYPFLKTSGLALARLSNGLAISPEQEEAVKRYFYLTKNSSGEASWAQRELIDNAFMEKWRLQTLYTMNPNSHIFKSQWRKLERGWYVPENRLFPMGDNRDDSRDARYFGSVRLEKVLGRALFKYWPISRLGSIR